MRVPEDTTPMVAFERAALPQSDRGRRIKQRDYLPEGRIPVIDQGQSHIGGYTNDDEFAFHGELPVVLFGDHTRAVKLIDHRFAVGADGVKIFRPADGVRAKYLYYWMKSARLPDRGYGRHYQFLRELSLPLPKPTRQDEIVGEIEKQFSRLDEAVANLKRVSKKLKSYKGAILTEATSVDLEILPIGWRWSTVGELAEVGTGATPKRDRADYWRSGTVPWVASAAVNKAIVTEPTGLITELALKETNCRVYPPGTLLVAMYGEGKTRGTCAELGIAAATNQALAAIQVPAKIRPYLKLVLQASYERTRRVASGGVQPNLNLSHVRSIRVPLPPVEDQSRIIAEAERSLSVAQEVERQVNANLVRADRMRQAVLVEAYPTKEDRATIRAGEGAGHA